MVSLSLFDVADVCTDHILRLNEFDKVHEAYKGISTAAKTTSEFDDTEKSKQKLKDQDKNRNPHK